MRFVMRLVLNGVALVCASYLVPGLTLTGPGPTILAAVALGLVNAFIRPVLIVLTLPFTLITLGLFVFVVNAICLGLAAWLVPGFRISGFGAALLGALIVSVASWILNAALVSEQRRTRGY